MVLDVKNFITWVRSFLDDVYALKSEIQSGVTLDNNVTQNSSNAVKSSGIYTALSGKSDTGHGHTTSDISDWLNKVYPVGSIYMSASDVNPSTLFGGTWEKIEDKFLLSSGSSYSATYDSNGFANKTGGEATHSLTQSEMPRHTHTQNSHSHDASSYKFVVTNNLRRSGERAYTSSSNNGIKYLYHNTTDDAYSVVQSTKGATATNKYTGGSGSAESASNGVAHNNMPPYLVINVWKRTA